MSIQQLLAQLQGMGLSETGLGSTSADIGSALAGQYFEGQSLEDSPLTEQMFQTINPNLLKSASISAYSHLLQQKQSQAMPQLIAQLGGQQA